MGRMFFAAAVFVAGTLSATLLAWSQTEIHTWTDVTGKHRIEASFLRLDGGKVVLQRADGSTVAVELERLSERDRQVAMLQDGQKKKPAAKLSPKKATKAKKSNAVALASAPGEWTQWRGPNRDGLSQETGLLDQWPEEGPPVLWKVGGLGSGYSSVAIADGKIFTIGRLGGKDKLIALDVSNGEQVWTSEAGSGGPDPNGTPTVDGDLVYCVTCGGDLLCAESATGKEVWRKNYQRDFKGKMMSGWGYSESVLIDGDHLICTPGAQQAMMAALDKRTGKVIWTTSVPAAGSKGGDGAAYSSPVISNAGGVKQYVQLVGRGVIGVDAKTGALLWGYNDIANGTANIPTPIVQGDYVFCSTGYSDGGSALLKLTGSRGKITPQVVYSFSAKEMQNHHGGMLLVDKYLYMGHGHNNGFPLCVEFLTGKEMWRPGRGPGSGSAAVTYADGHLYFRYEDGVMALIEATPQEYRLKGQFRIAINHGKSWPHPVIAGGRLYLRDQSELICYDVRKK